MKQEEKVIAVCRPHWVGYILNILIAIFLIIVGFAAGDGATVAVMLIIAAILIIDVIIKVKTTYIELTDTRIIGHIGFVNSKTLSTPLSRVQNLGLSNGLLGKIFGYHTITVSDAGSGSTEYVFRKMAGAKAFVDAVNEKIE